MKKAKTESDSLPLPVGKPVARMVVTVKSFGPDKTDGGGYKVTFAIPQTFKAEFMKVCDHDEANLELYIYEN